MVVMLAAVSAPAWQTVRDVGRHFFHAGFRAVERDLSARLFPPKRWSVITIHHMPTHDGRYQEEE